MGRNSTWGRGPEGDDGSARGGRHGAAAQAPGLAAGCVAAAASGLDWAGADAALGRYAERLGFTFCYPFTGAAGTGGAARRCSGTAARYGGCSAVAWNRDGAPVRATTSPRAGSSGKSRSVRAAGCGRTERGGINGQCAADGAHRSDSAGPASWESPIASGRQAFAGSRRGGHGGALSPPAGRDAACRWHPARGESVGCALLHQGAAGLPAFRPGGPRCGGDELFIARQALR